MAVLDVLMACQCREMSGCGLVEIFVISGECSRPMTMGDIDELSESGLGVEWKIFYRGIVILPGRDFKGDTRGNVYFFYERRVLCLPLPIEMRRDVNMAATNKAHRIHKKAFTVIT